MPTHLPLPVLAGLWGLAAASSLLLGAIIAYVVRLPRRLVAGVMAFGAGVLISALAFDLMEDAFRRGGFAPVALGFVAGGLIYTGANLWLNARGAHHRKHSGDAQHPAAEGGGVALALGALLDGLPESVVIGVSLVGGGAVDLVTAAAVFLSNLPEGLASAAGMRTAGRRPTYVFGVWGGIVLASGAAAMLGASTLEGASPRVIASADAFAAGGVLAMLADTMIPEAVDGAHGYAGLLTVLGFLAAFALSMLAG